MPVDKTELLRLLEVFDGELKRRIRINAVGGTALTLLGVKASTLDIDFDTNSEDHEILEQAIKRLSPGYRIGLFTNGMIFTQQLPEDYLKTCVRIESQYKNIELCAISPLDVICTKIGRLNERDIQDIRLSIEKFGITREQIRKRAKQIGYAASDAVFLQNTGFVLEKLCKG